VELDPPVPFSMALDEPARGASVLVESDLEDWAWAMRLEEELDYDLLANDVVAVRRQRLVGRVRVVALVAAVSSVVGVIRIGFEYGVGVGIVGAWALPVVVLAVVLSAEKVLLRFSR